LANVSGTFVSIRLEDFAVALAFLTWGFFQIRIGFKTVKDDVSRSIYLYWFIGMVAMLSGIFLTRSSSLSLGILHFVRRVEYMSLFLIAFTYLKSKDQLGAVIKVLIMVSLLVAIYGIGQQFFAFPVISTNNSEFSKGLALTLGPGARINSTFAGHYDLAAFTSLPLLLILAILPISKYKPLLILIWALIYWSLLMSASRITFAAFFISAGVLVILIKKRIWLIPLVLTAIVGVLISPQLRGRYLQFIQNSITVHAQAIDTVPDALKPSPILEDRSFNIRLNVEWPRAIRAFIQNPILGTGYSSVGLAVDNEYLRVLAETGILGFVAFTMIIRRLIGSYWSTVIKYEPSLQSAFVVTIFCFLITLLLGGVFIDVFAASKIALITWTLLGLAYKTVQIKA
jgi:O-antigen ligase